MAHEFKMIHRVEFADTDMAGIVHFASYFRYMEATEHAFFRSLGFSIAMAERFQVGWPRVQVECVYTAPSRFEDEIEVHLRVREKKERALAYDFVFRRVSPGPVVEVARGSMTAVCVTRDSAGVIKSVPIPEPVARAIEAAPPVGDKR
jgi:YbgC/YbaW family acyl-CoA thioester hydrolase